MKSGETFQFNPNRSTKDDWFWFTLPGKVFTVHRDPTSLFGHSFWPSKQR